MERRSCEHQSDPGNGGDKGMTAHRADSLFASVNDERYLPVR
jgi:hypothetical protein